MIEAEALNLITSTNALKEVVMKDEKGRYVHALVHSDVKPHDLDHLNERPRRVEQTENFSNVYGFIDYLKRFKQPNTVIFPNLEALVIGANLNYHQPSPGAEANPTWNKHHAVLKLKKDKDFLKWEALDGKLIGHAAFVDFLIDFKDDFLVPDKAFILELIKGLKAKSGSEIDSDVGNLSTKEMMVKTFQVNSAAGDIPDVFEVALPVIEGFGKYAIQFRLVFVQGDGGRFGVKIQLIRPHLIVDAVFNDIQGDIADAEKGAGVEILGYRKREEPAKE